MPEQDEQPADAPQQSEAPPPEPQPVIASPKGIDDASWQHIWHLPLLLIGVVMFGWGLWLLVPEQEQPNFPGALDSVGKYLLANELEKAQEKLKEIEQAHDQLNRQELARSKQYWADLMYMQVHRMARVPTDTEQTRQNNEEIVRLYFESQNLGRTLDEPALPRLAKTLVALGREQEAMDIIDQMTAAPAHRRYMILRDIIESHLAGKQPDLNRRLVPLIQRFRDELNHETDPSTVLSQVIWITGVQARQYLDADDPDGAIDFLLKRLPKLSAEVKDEKLLAPLRIILADAYQTIGELDKSEREYLYARQLIDSIDGQNAPILVGLGQIALTRPGDQQVNLALEYFTAAATEFPSEPAYPESMIGKGDCEARLGAYPQAIKDFHLAVDALKDSTPSWDTRREELHDVLQTQAEFARDQENYEVALQLLSVQERLHAPERPPSLLLDLARVHETVAMDKLARAESLDPDRAADDTGSVDAMRLLNQEASLHFSESAKFYREHAEAVSMLDDAEHGISLWRAAENYDRAQRWDKAIELYAEFVEERRQDPRWLRAKNRLGRALMADGHYEAAAERFLELLKSNPHSPETYDSMVPLAQAYIAMGDFEAARRGLENIVNDNPAFTSESRQYEEALIELGKLFYRMGEDDGEYFTRAIERLENAVDRYGDGREGATLRFLLADAYRKSIKQLDEELSHRRSQRALVELQADRRRRLEQAKMYYNQAMTLLEARHEDALTPVEKLYLRNAYFYQADCAYDLGQYDGAIRLYDKAARRWQDDPASLVALVQIVNARCELGQYQQARVANEHALRHLERIPNEAFDDPSLPMSRQQWEDWLRWTSELNLLSRGQEQISSADW